MLKDATKTLQGSVRARPNPKSRLNCRNEFVQIREVTIVETATPDQLPHAFDRIEFWTVWRQEMQAEVVGHQAAPGRMQVGMVIASVVQDDDHFPMRAVVPSEFGVEIPAGVGVKDAIGSGHDQLAVVEAYRAEKTDALACRRMEANGVSQFRRNPQAAARTVLLKMNFIQRPQVNVASSRQCAKFFYEWLAKPGRRGPVAGAVCASESPTAGTAAGTGAPLKSLPVPGRETPIASGHPTGVWSIQTSLGWYATPPPPRPIVLRSGGWGAPTAGLRPNRPNLRFQTAAPSSRRYDASPPAVVRRVDRSCLGPRAGRRAAGDRNARHRCAEFHPGCP